MLKVNKKAIELAYCQINGVSKSAVKEEQHQRIVTTALEDVWSNSALFPNENEALRDKRLDMEGPSNGEVTELAQHFTELYPDDFTGLSAWAIIFTMYNRMNGSQPSHKEADSTEEKESTATEVVKEEGSSDKTKILNEKELNTMEMQDTKAANLEELAKIEAGLSTSGTADVNMVSGSMPSADNFKATIGEAKNAIEKSKNERVNFTKNALVTEFVLAKPSAKEIAVDGEKAMGVVADPEKAFSTFCEKAGVEISPNGEVSFTNVVAATYEQAKTIYDALKEAKENPEKQFKVFFSTSTGTIKGFKHVDDKGGAGVYIKAQDLISLIMNKAAGLMRTSDPNVQVQVRKARVTNKKGNKGTGTAKSKDTKSFAGIASIAISNKKEGIERLATYHKELVKDDIDMRSGMKSELSFKYYRGDMDEDGNRKTGTWRIPLKVKQYGLDIIDKDKEVLGTMNAGVGATVSPINLDDMDALTGMIGELTELAALASVRGVGPEDSLFGRIRKGAAEIAAEDAKKQAEELEGVVL